MRIRFTNSTVRRHASHTAFHAWGRSACVCFCLHCSGVSLCVVLLRSTPVFSHNAWLLCVRVRETLVLAPVAAILHQTRFAAPAVAARPHAPLPLERNSLALLPYLGGKALPPRTL